MKILLFAAHLGPQTLFVLSGYFEFPIQERRLRQEANRLGVPVAITPTLTDQMVAEEQANEEKEKEARLRGQQELEARH